jgi:deoxyribonuclease-4
MRIGAHLSVSKSFSSMIERAVELGADAVQYFPKNPKSYQVKQFSPEKLTEEALSVKDQGVVTVCHSPYVTNLSTPDDNLHQKTVDSLVNDLQIAEAYQTPYVVVHCGKHVGQGVEVGIRIMIETINRILQGYQGPALLLLENTAGQGSELGQALEELCLIRSGVENPDRVGFCFDTCHAFAAGLADLKQWDKVAEFKEFWDHTPVVHLNDCKYTYGSHKDRHELLGKGNIGEENFKAFLTSSPIQSRWIIIESPVEQETDYAQEISLVKKWISE